jgi:hypothetical protein
MSEEQKALAGKVTFVLLIALAAAGTIQVYRTFAAHQARAVAPAADAAAEYMKALPPTNCVAGPGEKCPTPEWYADYQNLKASQAKYRIPKDEQDRLTGVIYRLNSEKPAGYDWDEATQKFVAKVNPAAPPTPGKK